MIRKKLEHWGTTHPQEEVLFSSRETLEKIAKHGLKGPGSPEVRFDLGEKIRKAKETLVAQGVYEYLELDVKVGGYR